ncbi:MAG: hypothetical protein ACLRRF_07975 [Clostridium fessum]
MVASDPIRHTATVTLTYGDNSILDPERVSAQLCQECFKKVADALWPTGFEKDWTYHCDVLMNMETEDIYPISSTITKCSIDDFWLHIDHEQETIGILYTWYTILKIIKNRKYRGRMKYGRKE